MSDYQEIYEEEIRNQRFKDEGMPSQYKSPGYNDVQDYYNDYPYEKSKFEEREINKFNNPQRKEQYYDYYANSSPVYYNNQDDNNKKRFYTPDRINENNLYLNGQSNRNVYTTDYGNRSMNMYNLREEYSYPSKSRVNIRKKVFRGSLTPQPYNNDYDKEEEYIDNYQYHETTNIKDKDNPNKKYDSITHIIGYSNLIPLNRMKNLYGNNNNYRNYNYEENRSYNNYSYQEPKIKKAIEKVQELQRGKKEYDNFMRNLNSNNNENNYYREENYRKEISTNTPNNNYSYRRRNENNYRIENIRRREENNRRDNYRNENLGIKKFKTERNFRVMNNDIRNEYYRKDVKNRIPHEKYAYKKNIKEDIDYYRNNDNYDREDDNIRRHEIYHKNSREKVTKYNKVPYMNDYKKNYSSSNIQRTTKNKINNRVYDYKYNNRNKYDTKNIPPNKLKSLIKVEEKTASLSFKNPQKKVNTYGENFDAEKYRREYVNVENVDDGRIENHIETSLSKDGQYLISVTSATKVYDENRNGNEEDNDEYERNEEVEEEEENIEEIPEKNVEEIVSTVTTKKKNLGDNYKYYESKDLRRPNLTSFTAHKRRGERTIYGNEEYETKEIKRYRIGPDGKEEDVEYIQNEDADDYEQQQDYDNNNNYREGQYYDDGNYDEENNYEQEEVYYQ